MILRDYYYSVSRVTCTKCGKDITQASRHDCGLYTGSDRRYDISYVIRKKPGKLIRKKNRNA